jgi:hypothetical protein
MIMRNRLAVLAVTLFACSSLTSARPDDAKPATPDDKEAEYAKMIDKRVGDIITALELTDDVKAAKVKNVLVEQYRFLRDWQDQNQAKIKAKDKEATEQAMAARKVQREKFLSLLSAELTPEQVETVKDKMTYNKVKVTYDGYVAQNPTMNDEQKAKVLAWLKEAREEAIDGTGEPEKSAIFNKYKGRINNYLSKEGVTKPKKPKEPTTKPQD